MDGDNNWLLYSLQIPIGKLGLFYLFNYLVLFLSGSGKYSVDKLILKK